MQKRARCLVIFRKEIIRQNKNIAKEKEDIKVVNTYRTRKPTDHIKILDYLGEHPDSGRRDIYKLFANEGTARKAITVLLKSNKLKETFKVL